MKRSFNRKEKEVQWKELRSNGTKYEATLRDGSRDNSLSARGITVLRIENRAIFENQPAVIELLKETVRRLKASGQSV